MHTQETKAEFKLFLQEQAQSIFREPAGVLKFPFVDPGGPYGNSLWDWDSFWSLKAAVHIKNNMNGDSTTKDLFGKLVQKHAIGVLNNLLDHQADDGSVPILLTAEDPDWFDSTKSPQNNMAKPILGMLAKVNVELGASSETIKSWLEPLHRFHSCYRERYRHATGLCVWANDIAIGVDDDPTAWGRPPFSSGNIYLNTLLHADLLACEEIARGQQQYDLEKSFHIWATETAEAIQTYCWDVRDGFFYSADVLCKQNISEHRHFGTLNKFLEPFWKCLPMKIMSWTGFLPMWSGLASAEQADRLVHEHLLNNKQFWTPFGIRTLSADERMYSPGSGRQGNPSNWLGPIWIIPCYMIWDGLKRYGYNDIARDLANRILDTAIRDFEKNHYLHEHYCPNTGEGQIAPGFVSWNLLLSIMLSDITA